MESKKCATQLTYFYELAGELLLRRLVKPSLYEF